MRNHWLRKKVAREEFSKCICKIFFSYGHYSTQNGHFEFPLQLKLNWINTIADTLYIKEVSIFDKNDTLLWSQLIGSNLKINSEIMLDFDGLIIDGYKAKDLFK